MQGAFGGHGGGGWMRTRRWHLQAHVPQDTLADDSTQGDAAEPSAVSHTWDGAPEGFVGHGMLHSCGLLGVTHFRFPFPELKFVDMRQSVYWAHQ